MLVFDCTTTMLWIILLATLSTVNAQKKSILTLPNVTAKQGGTAEFRCETIFSQIPAMKWEFNNSVVYSFQYGQEDYPKGNDKYSVSKDGTTFTLYVTDLQYSDGGTYVCQSLDQSEEANLIVLGKPQFFTASNPVEGSTVEFICTAQFGGPRKDDIATKHLPQLQMFLDERPLNGTTTEYEVECLANCYNLTQIHKLKLESSMNGKALVCEIKTNYPETELNITSEVNVLYSVRHVSYSPKSTEYGAGTEIKCTAEGNPEPNFQWDNTKTGHSTYGQLLQITKEMAGSNDWRCTARNNINGHSHEQSVVAAFNAILPPENVSSESGKDSWKIAVGVTIPICLAISSLIAWLCYKKMNKRYSPVPDGESVLKKGTSENGIPENKPLPDHLDETRLVYSDTSNRLLNTISGLKQDDALTDEVVKEIEDLLPKQGQIFPSDKPLAKFVKKSKYLIGSEKYLPLMQDMIKIHEKNHKKIREDLLSHLVDSIEKVPLTTHHTKLIKLLEKLVPLQCSTSETRNRCMWVLITSTKEWKMYRGENVGIDKDLENNKESLHWALDLIEILRLLLDQGADPSWSPEGSSEGSSLHVFLKGMYQLALTESELLKSSLDHFEKMIQKSSLTCKNVDSEGNTVLHSLAAGMKSKFVCEHGAKLHCIVSQCKAKNPAIIDTTDNSNCTSLHTFLISVFPDNQTKLTGNLVKFVNDIVSLLVSKTNINIQVKDSRSEAENIITPDHSRQQQSYSITGCTALHILTVLANNWVDHPCDFLAVVNCLVSDSNIILRDGQGRTPLEIFCKSGKAWKDCSETFVKVFKCLFSSKINIRNKEDKTVLDLYNSWEADIAYHPEAFLEIVKILKTSGSLDVRDDDNSTMLHKFTVHANDWKNHPDTFLEVVKCLRSPTNIDITNKYDSTALHKFIRGACEWKYHLTTYLEVVKCLKSTNNTDVQNTKGNTILHIITDQAAEWSDHREGFLSVIKNLKSDININSTNKWENTPLQRFISEAGEWQYHLHDYLEVVKCLKSPSNISIQNGYGETALHYFAEKVDGSNNPQSYLAIVKFLALKANTDLQRNVHRDTALHMFATQARKWSGQPEIFLDVVRCLKSTTNINIQNGRSDTALHIFTSQADEWKNNPKHFLGVVKFLRSYTNIEFQNEDGATALHLFISKAGEWREHFEMILTIIQCLVLPTNIDIQTGINNTALHIFVSQANKWKDHGRAFLKVLRSLISTRNLDIENALKETASNAFISKAGDWKDQPQEFFDVIKCLVSATNIDIVNIRGATALQKFTSYVDVWKEHPQEFIKVVKFLKDSSPNSVNFQDNDQDTVLQYLFFSFINWGSNQEAFRKISNKYSKDFGVEMEIKATGEPHFTCSLKPTYAKVIPELLLDYFKKFSGNTVNHKEGGETEIQISKSSRGEWKNSPQVFVELVKCLATPININLQNQDGDTALHYFARCEREWADHPDISEIIKCLMSSKNIQMKNNEGQTAMDLFRKNWGAEKITKIVSALGIRT